MNEWNRTDILGLLMAAYGLLLRSCPAAVSSPRNAPFPNALGGGDVRRFWRECMEAPAEFKSFSFARMSLLPALHKPVDPASLKCMVSEFLLNVLSEFSAHYLDVLSASGDRPISRAKWLQDAEEDLRLRRSHQERQQQFFAWSGTNATDEAAVPDAVDLLQRPDCMDDVIAFATAVCSLGSRYALNFWSREEILGADEIGVSGTKLVASRALRDLRDQQNNDSTLRASYLSFLAALALAKSLDGSLDGAVEVCEMLSADVDNTKESVTWQSLIRIIQWYAGELGPQDYSASTTASTAGSSSAYYYYSDEGDTSSSYGQTMPNADAASRAKPKELGEDSTYFLLSGLALISNVAAQYPSSRSSILAINLPIRNSAGREIVGQETTLTVLFSLAVRPLTPDVRGKVFSTISELLNMNGANAEQSLGIHDAVIKSWELLEAYQILPIFLFEQYSSISPTEVPSVLGLAFPPTSTALVS